MELGISENFGVELAIIPTRDGMVVYETRSDLMNADHAVNLPSHGSYS